MASQQARAQQLVALPSLSCALSSLPQAKNMDGVALHPSSFSNRGAESEAKLRKALNITSQNAGAGMSAPMPKAPSQLSPHNCPSPPPLMMRSHKSNKIRT
ncbi:hypothetical protein SCHPADRAFT_941341 [Schizopora paradoxa]|uniref:Uncharacterized protein n=1 Tax=Schizopora paradoxa TaxID=27342 RepID=A0A0H2RL27_9AGAM|nr:hypothetical protein SCHPADRAFT_941341 [Schizopora paradoxa]